MQQHPYRLVTIVAFSTIAVGVIFYHFFENLKWIDAIYFSVVTLATVGYGDITPKTDIGKLFTAVYILVGVGIIAAFINSIVRRGAERRQKYLEEQQAKENKK